MGRVIAVANQKGGVGKTTTAVNLSACLANDGHRTLLIDLDPQANATSGCEAGVDTLDGSVYEVLLGHAPLEAVICSAGIDSLDLAPSHISLAGAEVEMAAVLGREKRLTEALDTVRGEYDYVIIDCPPSLGLLTVNALTAADSVLIPVQCEYYALEGLSKLLNSIQLVQRYLNPTLEIEGVLLTMYDERLQLSKRVAAEVKSYFHDKVYETEIRRNVSLAVAPSFGQPVILYEPRSTGADNYRRLAGEVGQAQQAALA
jgi:chromosome partitioning protein